jgi:GDP-L-fucose synthase
MFKDKTVFIPGGRTGFLGTNFVNKLLPQGATVLAHSFSKKPGFLKPSPNLLEMTGPLTPDNLPKDLDIDYVIHCAAYTAGAHEMTNNPVAFVNENTFSNSHLLDWAALRGVKKFIFISSSAIYPNADYPLKEEEGFIDDPPGNYFGVGWMKRYTEKLANFYHKCYGMEVLIIRPSNIYGPFSNFDLQHSHVLPALIRKFDENHNPLEVWGSPDVVRDFIYVDDFVEGVISAFNFFSGFDVFNIASGKTITIGESVDLISELTDYKGEIIFNSSKPTTIHTREIDISKAKSLLGFDTFTSFKDGLEKTINWYKSNVNH